MKKNFYKLVLWCAMSLFGLNACTDYQTPAMVKVGVAPWVGYEPFFLARALNYYGQDAVKLVELKYSTETIDLLREGLLDVGALTLDEALLAIEEGINIKIILAVDSSNGADMLLAQPAFTSMESLQGHRIGVESNAVGAFLLQSALSASNMTTQDIQIVPLAGDGLVNSFSKHDVDAVVTYNPKGALLLKKGAVNLFDSSQIPNRIIDVLVVRQSTLDNAKDNIHMLVSGFFKALDFLKNHPEQAVTMMAPRLQLDEAEMRVSLKGVHLLDLKENQALFKGEDKKIEALTQDLQQVLISKGLLKQGVDTSQIFHSQFVEP